MMDVISITESEIGYGRLKLYSKAAGLVTFELHRLIAYAFMGPGKAGKHVDHIDRNPSNNELSNLRYLPKEENRFRQSTKEEQLQVGHSHKPMFKKVTLVKHNCEQQDDAWVDIGTVYGKGILYRQLSIMGNIRFKGSKEYIEQELNLSSGYQGVCLYTDEKKSLNIATHRLMGEVFNLHHEELPIKGVSTDPRANESPTADLYHQGEHIVPPSDYSLVIDHIDGDKRNNSVMNLRLVTQRMNCIAANGKQCALLDPETNERERFLSKTLANDAIGFAIHVTPGKRAMYVVGKRGSGGVVWKGKLRKKLWFSYLNEVFFIFL
jgi:hypothetical protein